MRVLFISGTEGDTRRYRCFHQREQLALNGVESAFREAHDFHILWDVLTYDLFILHRVPYSELVADALQLIEGLGKVTVFDTDDLIFDPSFLPYHRIMDTMPPDARRHYWMQVEEQARTFRRCSYVLTATEFLAQTVRQRGKKAFVNRNSLNQEMLSLSEEAYRQHQRRLEMEGGEDRLIVAYFSGTGSHNQDFLVVTTPLIHILESYPHVELHIGGQLDLSQDLSPFAQRIKRTPYLPWRELPFVIATVDINLAPLELENPVCRAKSALKYFEAGAVGLPTVASRMEPFERAIVHGSNGLLAQTDEEWIEALTLLIEDGEKRRAMGEAARRDVYQNYLPGPRGRHLASLLEAIHQDWQSRASTSSASSLADPQGEVIAAAKRHLTRQQELIAQKEAQLQGQRKVIEDRERNLCRLRRSLSVEKESLQIQLEESKRAQSQLEAQLNHWKSRALSQQQRHREELQHILLSLQPAGSKGTMASLETEGSTDLLLQQIEELIHQMQAANVTGWSGFRRKMGQAWHFLRSGGVAWR